MSDLKVISLFSGCGGFDLGAMQAGFTPLFAIDNDPIAVNCYQENLGQDIVIEDIDHLDMGVLPSGVDLVIGGPPCQGFSSAGPKNRNDKRNKLWRAYLKVLETVRPSGFILENVVGFRRELPLFAEAIQSIPGIDYTLSVKSVITQFYGVPQWRHRLFVVGLRKDINERFEWPNPSVQEIYNFNLYQEGLITMQQALQNLGPPIDDLQADSLITDHISIPLSGVDEKIAQNIPNGGSLKDIPDKFLPETYRGRKRTKKGWTWYFRKPRAHLPGRSVTASVRPTYSTILAPDVYYKKEGNKWTWNVVDPAEHTGKEGLYISPVRQRRLTVRECARLQTFPDTFRFSGELLDKYRLVGNAVPVEYARRICAKVRDHIEGNVAPEKYSQQILL